MGADGAVDVDGVAKPSVEAIGIRRVIYGAAAVLVRPSRKRVARLAALAGVLYAARPIRRAMRRLPPGSARSAAVAAVPALMAVTDLAKMTGYIRGLLERRRGGA